MGARVSVTRGIANDLSTIAEFTAQVTALPTLRSKQRWAPACPQPGVEGPLENFSPPSWKNVLDIVSKYWT